MEKNHILVATDSEELFEQVKSALLSSENSLFWVKSGEEAMEVLRGTALGSDKKALPSPDLLVSDMQIGSMGGAAISYDLYLETSARRVKETPIILLLDREADTYIAREVGASAYLIKPVDVLKLKQVAAEALAAKDNAKNNAQII